ncbi:App1 family protein [Haloferula chungangensis]|uniref:App1 family protein n=1 Tax=Haloferula chungangensis TaxID=1048331 RepID=A0ABW2LAD3_9BACT
MQGPESTPGTIHRVLLRLEKIAARLSPKRLPGERAYVRCFEGYAHGSKLVIRGRVERKRELRASDVNDSRRRNFLNMASNFFTKEIPHATVHGEILGERFQVVCDEEGYFVHHLEHHSLPQASSIEFTARVERADDPSHESAKSSGIVTLCPATAKRIIISDVDDTVIETGAAKLWQLLKNTLLENVHTRRIFPGVSKFYTRLQAGPTGHERNPIFYVTSSPWNLRDFILKIFEIRNTPRGPLFMTDWGIDRHKLLKAGHHDHKLGAIRHLLSFHEPLPAILIGDSGEKDPEIYTQIVEEHPERIAAIFIRNVSQSLRDEEIRLLAQACHGHGVKLHLVADTKAAVAEAKASGFIA